MVKITASHPDYEKYMELQRMLQMLCNPSIFLIGVDINVPEKEFLAIKQTILNEIDKLISNYLPNEHIANFINRIEDGSDEEMLY